MKRISLIILLAVFRLMAASQSTNVGKVHNKIDDIQSAKDIIDLMAKVDSDYRDFEISPYLKFRYAECQHLSDSLQMKLWVKADFDNNGYNDLLVVGYRYDKHTTVCIMDSGDNHFRIIPIYKWWFSDTGFPIYYLINNIPAICYYSYSGLSERDDKPVFQIDTLTFHEDNFIELSRAPAHHHIDSIRYVTDYCFGSCPVFSLMIRGDRSCVFDAISYNRGSGIYRCILDSLHYNKVTSLLNYIDFEKLDTSYTMNVTDLSSCALTIWYDHGKVKNISDYGLQGTFGLNAIYDLLYDLRDNQMWDKPYPGDMIKNETSPVLKYK